jgi:hypothetical protein
MISRCRQQDVFPRWDSLWVFVSGIIIRMLPLAKVIDRLSLFLRNIIPERIRNLKFSSAFM